MCGIVCLLRRTSESSDNFTETLQTCINKLHPRGPDSNAYHDRLETEYNIGFGFTRLAVMDTSHNGMQPFKRDNNVVVCNGEIYNWQEIADRHSIKMKSKCDCEVILPVFQKTGFVEMIKNELDAEFAMVVWSDSESKLYAARDRHGVRPLYYGWNRHTGTIGFASELKVLHGVMEFIQQVDPRVIIEIDVNLFLTVNDVSNSIASHVYYQYPDQIPIQISESESVALIHANIRRLLTQAVQKRLNADREIGFFLSGGLDSALIVYIASTLMDPANIVCFTIGMDGSPDVEAAKIVVNHLGIAQHYIVPFSCESGASRLPQVIEMIETYDVTTIRASTPQSEISRYVLHHTPIRVLLSGEGSDEIHGSYRYFRDAPNREEFQKERVRLTSELHYFDNKRTDRSTAGYGLEVRVPFLDYAYVDYVLNLDPSLFMYRSDYIEKKLIRDAFKGSLPDEILYRSKEAFSDAVSNDTVNWATSIQETANATIADTELMNARELYPVNPPRTKDALYFRRIFNEIYPGCDNIIPHYWLPKFQKTEVLDPSARVLNCYQ